MAIVDASARVVDDADANACAYAKAACKEALAGKEEGAETLLRVLEGATTKESADTEADTEALTFSLFDKDSDSSNNTTPAPETHGAGDTPEPGRRNIDTDMERISGE